MKCQCRQCHKVYDEDKSRADYKGYCSQACMHTMSHRHGYRTACSLTEYEVLRQANELGNIPVPMPANLEPSVKKYFTGSKLTYRQLYQMLYKFSGNQLDAMVELNMSGTKVFPKATDFVYPVE